MFVLAQVTVFSLECEMKETDQVLQRYLNLLARTSHAVYQ
jgi:hypothetical protein